MFHPDFELLIKPLVEDFKAPAVQKPDSAGYDLFAQEDIVLTKTAQTDIKCGFATAFRRKGDLVSTAGGVEISTTVKDAGVGISAEILPRSGFGRKNGMRIANTIGLIDSDYRGEWIVCAYIEDKPWYPDELHIPKGTAFAQAVFKPVFRASQMIITDVLPESERGEGGFGSTTGK